MLCLGTFQSDLSATLGESACTSVTACNDLSTDAAQLLVNPAADPALVSDYCRTQNTIIMGRHRENQTLIRLQYNTGDNPKLGKEKM